MKRSLLSCLAAAAILAAGSQASAGTVVSGFDANTLSNAVGGNGCDDCYSTATSLGFAANFFGQTYADTFVSNNGYITFGQGQGNYTPTGLTTAYTGNPIIAAFYADVDTRGVGSVTYGTGTYAGDQAFGVTSTDVGYYGSHTDKTNTFQEILVNRSDIASGDFDIYFNYNQIQFETGDASNGSDGLGGSSAAVGYANGAGTAYQLPGSLVNGAFIDGGPNSLVANSNDGVAGQFEFSVRNGEVIPSGVPEPSVWVMLFAGVAMMGAALRLNRRRNIALAA